MTHSPSPQQSSVTVTREMNLGQHVLILLSDQSIEVMRRDPEPTLVLCLQGCEAYRLLIALQEMFKEGREE